MDGRETLVHKNQILGLVLLLLGLVILFLLRNTLIAIIIFAIEFVGVVIGLILIFAGIAMIYGDRWMWGTWRK